MILWQQIPDEDVNISILCIVLKLLTCAGNENIHLLTSGKRQRLLVHLQVWESGESDKFTQYDNFRVGSEKNSYTLFSLGKSTGQYVNKKVGPFSQWRFYVGTRGAQAPEILPRPPKFLDTVVLLLVELIGSIVNFASLLPPKWWGASPPPQIFFSRTATAFSDPKTATAYGAKLGFCISWSSKICTPTMTN